MDYKLERKVSYNSEPEHKSLYRWCLNEIDEDDKKIGRDLVPWWGGVYFTASSLRVVRETLIEIKSEDQTGFSSVSSQKTRILGALHSGYPTDGEKLWDQVSFSLIGTNRKIEKFDLNIFPGNDGNQDLCSVVAIPSYEAEIDFRNVVTPDHLGFDVSLNRKFFDEIVRAIESGSADAVTMRVGIVPGFYSDWSPSISTDLVKVLADGVVVEGVDEGKFKPPTASFAYEFSLTIGRLNRLNLQNGFDLKKNESEFLEDKSITAFEESTEDTQATESKIDEYFRNSITIAVKLTSSLKFPLWAIFAVLVLLLFK